MGRLSRSRRRPSESIAAEANETERLRAELEAAREATERTVEAERAETARLREELAARTGHTNGGEGDEAEAAALLPPQRRELSGRSGEMVLNGAYPVHRSRAEAFGALAEELRREQQELGLQLELSGPWAPYNFVYAAGDPAR